MKRKLSLLMALMMVVALLPMSSFAASKASVSTQTVAADSSIRLDLVVEKDGALDFTTGGVFEIALGDNAEWATNANVIVTDQGGNTVTTVTPRGSKVLEITVPDPAPTQFNIGVNVQFNNAEGEQKVQVRNVNANVTNQTLTYAVVSGTGNIVVRALESEKTITRTSNAASVFEIREIDVDAFTGNTATLTLPRNFTWEAGTKVEKVVGTSTTNVTPVGFEGEETLTFNLTQNSSVVERFIVTPVVRPGRDANTGNVDVRVRISGTTEFIDIAEYKDYEVVAKVDKVQEIIGGHREDRANQVRVTLEGTGTESFLSNREISFKVTNGEVALRGAVVGGTAQEITLATADVEHFEDEFFVKPNAGVEKITLDLVLFGKFNAGGKDLELTVEGAGVEEQTIKLADILAPATVTVEKATDVILGLQNQMAPEITIVETEGAALREGIYWIDFPSQSVSGIRILDVDVEVESGDIDVDVDYDNANGRIILEVEGESRTASTIVIKDVKITLDRTVAFGPLNARLAYREDWTEAGTAKTSTREIQKDIPFLNVVTEIQDARKLTTVFSIDSVTYTVGTETRTLDAAPYISNNRTMLPIGTVAQLAGATVNYSPSSRTAVFTKDNLVVSMNLDTNILLVNGSPVAMDAKPEIVNSRAFVPVVYVAQAFGIQNGTDIVYDAATRTVTMFPNAQ
ncbi:hypothetical protein J2Z35_000920 [Acetoanaerobium pronyense]|uniref:Copper amine oxidase-like N-terminal domain-containing protein n=1 Tax=Acetoanaerobium pronyense TaxID=1482736 RepID=A0ABS4KIQ9_9FIRM|nr:copper amine oxidase N-terminal domain-containing protein [Acetoanaerobium pronyense]MBP2027126.1 hypothetical protein [Acetoanaerobium pronyense]